jgi:hypothetical protein
MDMTVQAVGPHPIARECGCQYREVGIEKRVGYVALAILSTVGAVACFAVTPYSAVWLLPGLLLTAAALTCFARVFDDGCVHYCPSHRAVGWSGPSVVVVDTPTYRPSWWYWNNWRAPVMTRPVPPPAVWSGAGARAPVHTRPVYSAPRPTYSAGATGIGVRAPVHTKSYATPPARVPRPMAMPNTGIGVRAPIRRP